MILLSGLTGTCWLISHQGQVPQSPTSYMQFSHGTSCPTGYFRRCTSCAERESTIQYTCRACVKDCRSSSEAFEALTLGQVGPQNNSSSGRTSFRECRQELHRRTKNVTVKECPISTAIKLRIAIYFTLMSSLSGLRLSAEILRVAVALRVCPFRSCVR